VASSVSFPNTPESDAMAEVWNDVTVVIDENDRSQDEVVRVLASDPYRAIEMVRDMSEDAFQALDRLPVAPDRVRPKP
jgi:hypothetical protein